MREFPMQLRVMRAMLPVISEALKDRECTTGQLADRLVKVALREMREPTEEMVNAGSAVPDGGYNIRQAWRTMIDAARL